MGFANKTKDQSNCFVCGEYNEDDEDDEEIDNQVFAVGVGDIEDRKNAISVSSNNGSNVKIKINSGNKKYYLPDQRDSNSGNSRIIVWNSNGEPTWQDYTPINGNLTITGLSASHDTTVSGTWQFTNPASTFTVMPQQQQT